MSDNKDILVTLSDTAISLGVVDSSLSPDESRDFLLELAQKNPRVFEILCSANALHNHCENGNKLF